MTDSFEKYLEGWRCRRKILIIKEGKLAYENYIDDQIAESLGLLRVKTGIY